jgi:hypothetical protein
MTTDTWKGSRRLERRPQAGDSVVINTARVDTITYDSAFPLGHCRKS